jgi:uncharacterized protein (TIGR03067 family)
MRAMQWHVAIALAALGLLAADASDEAAKRDIEKWQGAWQAGSMENDGKPTPADQLKKIELNVKGTDYHFRNGSFNEHGSYKFHAAKNPKEIDIVVGDGADRGKVYLAIYQVDADKLIICLDAANKTRPKEFTGKAGSGCVLEVWQRMKP